MYVIAVPVAKGSLAISLCLTKKIYLNVKKERTNERTNEISCSFCPSHNVVKSFHLCQVNYFSSIKKKELIRKMKSIFTREKKRLLINLL